MASGAGGGRNQSVTELRQGSSLVVWAIAGAYVAVQLAVSGRYGYFRDEFYYLACGDHLAWGYVDHPPLVAVIARISRVLLGESPFGIRMLSAIAGGATIVMTGRLSRLFGGGAFAAALAALAVSIAPVLLFLFHILSMNAWDVMLWTAVLLVVARIVVEGRPSLWPLVGVLAGIGLENKHSMAFLLFGLGVGVLLTRARRWLVDWRLWVAAAIAAGLFAPHVWWQVANGWPTLEFVRNATTGKNLPLTPVQFVAGQLLDIHPLNFVLLIAGLVYLFAAERGRFRLFGWTYVAVFVLLVTQRSKTYYLSPIYPMMLAAGSVAIARLSASRAFRAIVIGVVVIGGALTAPFTLPVLPVEKYIAYQDLAGLKPSAGERHELGVLPQHYADMFGWDEIVETIARVYRSLPPEDRAKAAIFALNYGDAGAIDLLGPRHGLPLRAISPHNNYFLWGPGNTRGEVLIVLGGRVEDHRKSYADVRRVDTVECGYCMPYENHRPVYVLRQPVRPLDEIWRTSRIFM